MADIEPSFDNHPIYTAGPEYVRAEKYETLETEVERLKRLLVQRGKDAADAEDEVTRLREALGIAREFIADPWTKDDVDRVSYLGAVDAVLNPQEADRG